MIAQQGMLKYALIAAAASIITLVLLTAVFAATYAWIYAGN